MHLRGARLVEDASRHRDPHLRVASRRFHEERREIRRGGADVDFPDARLHHRGRAHRAGPVVADEQAVRQVVPPQLRAGLTDEHHLGVRAGVSFGIFAVAVPHEDAALPVGDDAAVGVVPPRERGGRLLHRHAHERLGPFSSEHHSTSPSARASVARASSISSDRTRSRASGSAAGDIESSVIPIAR